MNKSDSIKELATALAKFQAEVQNPANTKKVSTGSFSYNYAPLNEILSQVRPLLSKHGLSIVQAPTTSENNILVSTMLIHSSGEWIELDPVALKMDKVTAQGAGSAITYARRYSLSAVLGISSEDDDDANSIEPNTSAVERGKKGEQQATQQPQKSDEDKKAIVDNSLASDAQVNYINKLVEQKGYGMEAMINYIKTAYNKSDVKALGKKEAGEVINMLNGLGA